MCKRHKNGNGKRRGNGLGTLRKVGKYFYALFYVYDELTGERKRITRATGKDNREEACAELDRLAAELGIKGAAVNPTKANLTAKQLAARQEFNRRMNEKANALAHEQKKLADERQRLEDKKTAALEAEKRRNAIGIADAFVYYRASLKRPQSGDRTLWDYECNYDHFASWMKEHHPEISKLFEVSSKIADEYAALVKNTYAYTTFNKRITVMRMFWRVLTLEENSLITTNPWKSITLEEKRLDYVRHRDITTDELRRTIKAISSDEMRNALAFRFDRETVTDLRSEFIGLFCVGIYTGLRLGDCINLKFENIDLEANTISVTPSKTKRHGVSITIPIHKVLRAHLLAAENRKGYLLPNLAEIYNKHDQALVTTRIQRAFNAAGIETLADAPHNGRRRTLVGFHSLRHFYCATLSNAGINQELVNYLSSHSQGKVTANYYHGNKIALTAAIATLPALPEILPPDSTARLEIVEDARERQLAAFMALAKEMDADTLAKARNALAAL